MKKSVENYPKNNQTTNSTNVYLWKRITTWTQQQQKKIIIIKTVLKKENCKRTLKSRAEFDGGENQM